MSVESCTRFLRLTGEDPLIQQQMKALTGVAEVIRFARRNGYDFTGRDLATAVSSDSTPPPLPPPATRSEFYHHEFAMDDLPGFEAVVAELPHLKIMPSTVDLARFDDEFREEDLLSTSLAPSEPAYLRWREQVAGDGGRRDFHLVNLDNHVTHPRYDDYLAAKTRVIAALEQVFGDEVRFSGSMWYPPNSYRLWHTHEDQPGWRMYLVDLDADFPDPDHTSFFRYQHPDTGELVTLRERSRIARLFRIEQDPERRFWHCIVNPTRRHRWSFGFVVPDHWAERLADSP